MSISSKVSVKVKQEGKDFLYNIGINCIKTGSEQKMLSFAYSLERMERYFKLNNDKYLEMLKCKEVKNV